MRLFHLSSVDPIVSMSEIFTKKIVSIVESGSPTLILLSAGSWVHVYERISKLPEKLDYSNMTIGLVDERWVPYDDKNRNERQIKNTKLIQCLELRRARFLPMIEDVNSDRESNVAKISRIYRNMKIDGVNIFITIGIGVDGHVAGILPIADKSLFNALYGTPLQVVYYETRSDETTNPHWQRLTITPDFIRSADEIMVYACGAEKRRALERLQGRKEQMNTFPAQILTELGTKVTLYSDLEV